MENNAIKTVLNGHAWVLDSENHIDLWQLDVVNHNGPRCVTCELTLCHHCQPDWRNLVCSNTDQELPGFEIPIDEEVLTDIEAAMRKLGWD